MKNNVLPSALVSNYHTLDALVHGFYTGSGDGWRGEKREKNGMRNIVEITKKKQKKITRFHGIVGKGSRRK